MVGTVDLGGIDLGNVDTFGDRMALARVVGGKAVKKGGRWVMLGGVRDGVRLDHPTILRVLGDPLEAEAGTVRYEPDGDEFAGVVVPEAEAEVTPVTVALPAPAAFIPGPELESYVARLVCPAKLDYAVALINEMMGGCPAEVPAGMSAELAEKVARRVRSLARRDSLAA